MEISIDLKLMREIVFRDEPLLLEMVDEWIQDSDGKMDQIIKLYELNNYDKLFNKIHELKTNFSMIHCPAGIQCCERMIRSVEKQNLENSDINQLITIVADVKGQLLNQIEPIK